MIFASSYTKLEDSLGGFGEGFSNNCLSEIYEEVDR